MKGWKNVHLGNGLCLDVEGGDKHDGARFISYGCHNGTNQQFRVTPHGEIQAKHSKKCMSTSFRQKKCKPMKKTHKKVARKRNTRKNQKK
jgi:hypothetical protein